MKKILLSLLILLFISHQAHSQTTQPFGVVDTADLRLTDCDFEKGANAMVLFDKAEISTSLDSVVMNRHTRVKIFNDAGKDEANIRLQYYSYHNYDQILAVEAQTISLENNKIIYTKVEPDQVYNETVDKDETAIVFTFAQVKPGCVIEYRYKWITVSAYNFPDWFFQNHLPTRYSELTTLISKRTNYITMNRGYHPSVKDTLVTVDEREIQKRVWTKTNVGSKTDERFVTEGTANRQCLIFKLNSVIRKDDTKHTVSQTWSDIASDIGYSSGFGQELSFRVPREDTLLRAVKTMSTNDEKIAYLFGLVKTSMKWNNRDSWHVNEGIRPAWSKKTGNSTEINLILFRLLKKAGINAHTMLVSTRENGELNPLYASYDNINKTVIYVPVDSTKYYVLDATSKYNVYNDVPLQLLNTYGLVLDVEGYFVTSRIIFLKNEQPAQQVVMINGDISATGEVTGSAEISNYSYNREYFKHLYDTEGQTKYIDALRDKNNELKIKDLTFENMQVDSLPLVQKFNFDLDLIAQDDKYIYFSPNIFTPLHSNPFLKEERFANIDFGNCNGYSINGRYKLPVGYTVDALPKNLLVNMGDRSITFKRVIGETNGFVELHYTITRKRSKYQVEEYPALREFYKKMYDMLNEPVVLKKG